LGCRFVALGEIPEALYRSPDVDRAKAIAGIGS
jgi:hypothetical protein